MLRCNVHFTSVTPFIFKKTKKEGGAEWVASKKIHYTQIQALIAAAVAYFSRVSLEAGDGVIYGCDFENYLKLSPPELTYCTTFVHLN